MKHYILLICFLVAPLGACRSQALNPEKDAPAKKDQEPPIVAPKSSPKTEPRADDTLDFNIAIRTLIKKNETVFLQVGGGIVYNSNKQDEYQETFDKAKSFLCIL